MKPDTLTGSDLPAGAFATRLPEFVGVAVRAWAAYSGRAPGSRLAAEFGRLLLVALVDAADTLCERPAAVPVCCCGVAGMTTAAAAENGALNPATTMTRTVVNAVNRRCLGGRPRVQP